MKQKKNDRWIKYRHRIVRNIVYAVLYPYSRIKYRIKVEKFKEQGDRSYLILMNHQTPFDQFFVGMSFSGPVYYLASEDIFSKGWVSSLIRFLVAPIPIKKQANDIRAVMNCIRVAKEGGTIAIAPEGNRTYSGKTEHMNETVAAIAKRLKLPIALYRIEGGYGAHPRWSDVVRKGKMVSYVSKVIEPEEYAELTDGELFSLIKEGLYVNDAKSDTVFLHKKRAEYLERAIYVCPFCGLSVFESKNEFIECKSCKRRVEYLPTTQLSGVGFEFPFEFVNDWYEYQNTFVQNLDLTLYNTKPLFTDNGKLIEVIIRKSKKTLKSNAEISLYGNRIEIDENTPNQLTLPFDDISSMAVLGRNKLNIYYQKTVYQLKGGKRFNALKYLNIYYHFRGIKKGDGNGEFLGL